MSKYDTTYANETLTAISGFKINGTDIGKSATPGVDGYTTDDPTTNDAFKTASVSFNQLFSTSKPLVVIHSLGSTTNHTVEDYKFRENVGNTNSRDLFRFTIPNVKGIQIPLRILLIGGGGGGGSSAKQGHYEGAGGGGAGTFLELTMTLDERHDQAYFRGNCGSGGGGGGYADDANTYGVQGNYGGNTVLELRNASAQVINQYSAEGGAGGGGNRTTNLSYPNRDGNNYGSCGGCCGVGGTKQPVAAGSTSYSENIYRDEHPITNVDAVRVNSGGGARHIQGGGGGGGAGGAGGTGGTIGGFYSEGGRVIDTSEGFGGANGGAGYKWITGSTYAGGGGGDNRTNQSMQHGNNSYDRYGSPGQGGSGGGGGNSHGERNATNGTGSGGMGSFDWWSGVHGGNGGTGFMSIGIPQIFTEADHHTFIPAYLE